jgi:hypothetical protein
VCKLRLFWGDLKCGVQLGRSPVLNIDRAARRIPISETRFRKEYRLEYTSIGQLSLNVETSQLPSSESADGSSFSIRPFFRSSAMSKSSTKMHMQLVNVTPVFQPNSTMIAAVPPSSWTSAVCRPPSVKVCIHANSVKAQTTLPCVQ